MEHAAVVGHGLVDGQGERYVHRRERADRRARGDVDELERAQRRGRAKADFLREQAPVERDPPALGADELITSEGATKPMHRAAGFKITAI